MKTKKLLIPVTFAALLTACATVTPIELINARSAQRLASNDSTKELAPAEFHKAKEALILAEKSFLDDSDSYKTKDLAYVAQRKFELASALGAITVETESKKKAEANFQNKQAAIVEQGKQDLRASEKETEAANANIDTLVAIIDTKDEMAANAKKAELNSLAAVKAGSDKAEAENMKQAELVKQVKQDLSDSEKRTAEALAKLAALVAVKEEERGLVVTLSGSVLFLFNESSLIPSAQVTLNQVFDAMQSVNGRNLIVEGHTDSVGDDAYNQTLSQLRSDAVRNYLIQRGYPSNHIRSTGKGEGSPIASNESDEGRANNRRVEIVIERELHTSNK